MPLFTMPANPSQVLQWLEMCNTPGKGKITPQPLYEFMADKVWLSGSRQNVWSVDRVLCWDINV